MDTGTGNMGLPNSYPTSFPNMREVAVKGSNNMGSPADAQDHSASIRSADMMGGMGMNPAMRALNMGSTPTPLGGPGNPMGMNPPVDVAQSGGYVIPDGMKLGPNLGTPISGGPAGDPPMDAMGLLMQPGSDIRPPLVPGVVPNAASPGDDTTGYGLGTR